MPRVIFFFRSHIDQDELRVGLNPPVLATLALRRRMIEEFAEGKTLRL
jgi:hypothetical protein